MWSIARPLCDSWASCLLFLLHIVVRGVTVMAWDGATSDGHVAWFDSRMFRCHLTTLRNVMQLHWLPVRSRVQCKLCTLMHAIHNKRSPSYLSNAVHQLLVAVFDHLPLYVTDSIVPRTFSKFGERVFVYAGPAAWNRLPEHIRRQSTPATFRRHLKMSLLAEVVNTT